MSKLIERLTALVGLATGAAALIYTTGAAVYAATLNGRDVPSALSIATSLPREFLIGSGLLFVALPVALAAVVLFLLSAVLRLMEDLDRKEWRGPTAAVVVFAGCIGLAIAVQPCSWPTIVGVLIGVAVTVFALTALELKLAERHSDEVPNRRQTLLYLIAIGVLLMTGWGVWIGIARTDLPDALLCTKSGGGYPGFLIGETSSRVYIGEDPELRDDSEVSGNKAIDLNGQTRIISVPSGEIAELFVGSAEGKCLLSPAGSEKRGPGSSGTGP